MSAQLKEALASVDSLFPTSGPQYIRISRQRLTGALKTIRTAIEAAQREREDWLDISAWESAGPAAQTMTCDPDAKLIAVVYRHESGPEFVGETFEEALHNAAEWCRAEMAK